MFGSSGGGRGRGGRSSGRGGRSSGRGGRGGGNYPKPKLPSCSSYVTKGECKFQNSCHFAHIIRNHAQIELPFYQDQQNQQQHHRSNNYRQNNYNQNQNSRAAVSDVSIWETQGAIKIFIGSHDGYWRLYNTTNFSMEFENRMGDGSGIVQCLEIASNYLFCGFEGISTKLPSVKVGMIHAWNLNSPSDPPLEFHINKFAPYAHSTTVSCLKTVSGAVISGSKDGTIRLWQFNPALQSGKGGFALTNTFYGHVRQITGLTIVNNSILWSCSLDHSMRIWDLNSGDCQHLICKTATPTANGTAAPAATPPNDPSNVGHDNAITALLTFENDVGKFVLSGSLDGTIKAWNGATGECLASENHNQGVVSMALNTDSKGNPIVVIGLEDGMLVIRNILQIQNIPPFTLMTSLAKFYATNNHDDAIQCITSGPSNTFYSGGKDGRLLVWQITGDMGANHNIRDF